MVRLARERLLLDGDVVTFVSGPDDEHYYVEGIVSERKAEEVVEEVYDVWPEDTPVILYDREVADTESRENQVSVNTPDEYVP